MAGCGSLVVWVEPQLLQVPGVSARARGGMGFRSCRSPIPPELPFLIGMAAESLIGIDRITRSAWRGLPDRHQAESLIGLGRNTHEDGNWDLKINRAGRSEDPEEAFTFLPETYYHAMEGGPTYHVVISLGGTRASIEGELGDDTHFVVKGNRTSTADGHLWYELDWFGGGRFVVWSTAEGLQGELTWYGSGMPILFSHRGRLVKVP
jgi:hypothetical protein